MRRPTLLAGTLIFFLLTGVVPGFLTAATTGEPPKAMPTSRESTTAIANISLSCAMQENLSVASFPGPFQSPSSWTQSESGPGCGACSDSPCRLTDLHHNCWIRQGLQTFLGTCEEVIYAPYACTEDGSFRCTCMGEPPY